MRPSVRSRNGDECATLAGGPAGGGGGGGMRLGERVDRGALLPAGSLGGAVAGQGQPTDAGSLRGADECGRAYHEVVAGDGVDGGAVSPAVGAGQEGGLG